MQLLNRSNLDFELKIESLDDLWILSEFILEDDIIFSTTTRKVKIGNENSKKQVTKIIFVELKVKNTNFENEVLRISGEIQNETEFTAIGQNHTLNFNLLDKIKIKKHNLLKFEEKLLENSIKSKKSSNLLILLDKDELIAVEFSNISYSILFEEKGLGSKKYTNEEINEPEQKYNLIKDYLKKDYSQIILAGPFNYKEKLKNYIKDKINLNCISLAFSDVNSNSIQKLIEKINQLRLCSNAILAKESEIISILLKNINKGEKFAYGKENTTNSITGGQAQILLITTKLIEKEKVAGNYKTINDLMKTIEQLNGELIIINSKYESGKILDGLSGIASINRY